MQNHDVISRYTERGTAFIYSPIKPYRIQKKLYPSLQLLSGTGLPRNRDGFEPLFNFTPDGDDGEIQVVREEELEIDNEFLSDLDDSKPSEWMVMKEMLGINIFTFILAGLIAIFLSLNLFLGPGWLGQQIGLEGTGTFTQVSDSLPDKVDLSRPENLL